MKYALIILVLNGFNSPVDQHMVTVPMQDAAHCEKARTQLIVDWPRFYTQCLETSE